MAALPALDIRAHTDTHNLRVLDTLIIFSYPLFIPQFDLKAKIKGFHGGLIVNCVVNIRKRSLVVWVREV